MTIYRIQENDFVRDATVEEAALMEAEAIEAAKVRYIQQRAQAYPPITDYLDGIVKGDAAQVQQYINACLAVKTKYPKPTAT